MAFGERINDTVEWIQTKIKKYDQAAWETQAEKKLKDFPTTFTTKRTKLKKELIDVDLIKGTNYEKPKPLCSWSNITFFGMCKLIFLPLYFKWWTGKTTCKMYCVLTFLWSLQVIQGILVLQVDTVDDVLMCETLTPLVLWMVVGLTFCQAVATDMKKAQKSGISTLIKKSKASQSSKPTTSSSKVALKTINLKQHSKQFNKKIENSANLRRRVVLRNSTECLKITTKQTKPVPPTSTGNGAVTSRDNPTWSARDNPTWSARDDGFCLTSDVSDSDTSPTKEQNKGFVNRSDKSASGSDVETIENISEEPPRSATPRKGKQDESVSSSESDRESDSSGHYNGMTESMWTESETDSRAPSFKVRKPAFSTISESNTGVVGEGNKPSDTENGAYRGDHESSSDNETDKETSEVKENRANTPSGERERRDSVSDNNRGDRDRIRVKVWMSDDLMKVEMSPLEIGYHIISKVEQIKSSLEYVYLGIVLSFLMSILPFVFRAHSADIQHGFSVRAMTLLLDEMLADPLELQLIHIFGFILSTSLSCCFFTLFVVAERTYSQRYLYAKYFNALTTMRRAKQYGLPHFRLRSIQNIKAWLSLRSVLRRVGPQRSVGIIITSTFLILLTILTVVCVQFFSKGGESMNMYFTWLAIAWSMCVSVYLLRLFTLGNDIAERFDSHTLLITEQINLFFFLQQSPQKKEQLLQANQVLQLSSKLLKEIDSRETSVFFLSPLFSQFLRVFLLSAFSGLASEILGFKLKLWKMIK